MKPSDVRPITELKTKTAQILAHVNLSGNPLVITQNGEPRAVMMDVRSYERMQQSLLLLKLIAQSEDDVRRGLMYTQSSVEKRLERRFRR
jgi:prevent-host-death family protein